MYTLAIRVWMPSEDITPRARFAKDSTAWTRLVRCSPNASPMPAKKEQPSANE